MLLSSLLLKQNCKNFKFQLFRRFKNGNITMKVLQSGKFCNNTLLYFPILELSLEASISDLINYQSVFVIPE
ncbi:hypothetical protein SLEP1_g4443 [Rubroshorea leprosula]|uniref:Uncharacterized protein n=1 Tax=Rubroshorea leprosula TaxID=152421 RepID=A0AAV5HUI0_9ROSI|nr:hypothetical protein SLEP1_g4443 [Rubroshorea leprosula]